MKLISQQSDHNLGLIFGIVMPQSFVCFIVEDSCCGFIHSKGTVSIAVSTNSKYTGDRPNWSIRAPATVAKESLPRT